MWPVQVDDFGVCGGNSSTGSIVVDLDMVADASPGQPDYVKRSIRSSSSASLFKLWQGVIILKITQQAALDACGWPA